MLNVPKTGTGTKVAKNSPIIPYLMFANDCPIFYKANRKVARHVKTNPRQLLQNFWLIGQFL